MKRSLPHGKMQETTTKAFKSSTKNTLAQRLFDAPGMRSNEQKRPRVFSNETNQNKLTPTIVREYQSKKQTQGQILPPIQTNSRKGRIMTEEAEGQYIQNERITNMRKNWLQQGDKNSTINQMKAKQTFNKTRHLESRMNRTLTESRHVIHLIDKMKGQFAVDRTKQSRLEYDQDSKLEQREPQRLKQSSKFTQREILKGKKEGERTSGVLNLQNSKQIDLFIFMAEDGKIPDYQFYYMIKEESNDYYNMDIVTYQTVMRKKLAEYYTLSGHGVTKYEDSRPVEFIALSDWDAERRQFNELKELQFFKKFRKWKTLKKWITILSRSKLKRISDILSENLFVLNQQYRSILLAHHNICFDIQQFKCLYVPTEPLTIDNFRKQQEKKKNSLIFSLKQCSKEMHKNSSQKLKNVVEELKSQVLGGEQLDEKDDKEGNLDEKIQAFVELGFSSNISFGHRSTVRSQFMRFLRLAYLLDFIAIDSLGKMVLESLQGYMQMLYGGRLTVGESRKENQQEDMLYEDQLGLPPKLKFGVTTNPEGKNIFQDVNPSYKPILQLQAKYNLVEQLKYRNNKINFTQMKNTFFNFDLEGFLHVQEVKGFNYEEDTQLSYREVQNVCKSVVRIEPSQQQINFNLIECVTQTMDALQIIEKWGKNEEFSQYVRALEEWDEIIGQRWEGSDQRYLSIVGWLREQPIFKGFKGYIKSSVGRTNRSVKQFVEEHANLLSTFQRNRRSNLQILADNNLQDQGMAFQTTYEMFTKCEEYMSNFLLQKADIFIYSVDASGLRQELLDSQGKLIKDICMLYVRLIKQRGAQLKEWLARSIQELTGLIIRIQQFVTLKKNADRINIQISEKREQISILAKLLSLLESSKFTSLVGKEDKDIIDGLNNLAATLSLTLSDVQNQMPKYVERFKRQIRQTLQKFEKQSEEVKDLLSEELYNKNSVRIQEAAENLNKLNNKVQNLQIYTKKHREYEEVLEVTDYTNFKEFKQLKSSFIVRFKVFNGIIDLDRYAKEWNQWKVMKMEVKELSSVCDKYMKDLLLAQRGISENHALPLFKKKLFVFKDAIPVITALRCPYLQDEDYKKLQNLLKTDATLKNNQQLNLQSFMKMPFQEVQEEILNVSTTATQCFYLKRELDNFESDWTNLEVKLKQFKETSDIIIVYEVEQLTAKLDESMATVSNLLSNRYITQLRERAERLNNQILGAQQLIQKLVECQRKWVYLENIFAAQDIKKQLMVEAGYFQQADKYLKSLTKKASAKPLITRLLKNTNISDLTKNLELLEEIQKKLEDYLEVKRRLFSRFYFISNDELVEILANSNSMNIVQKHINKLFEGVGSLHIQKQTPTTVEGFISPEGEIIKLVNGVSTRFNIEMWLNNLQKEMIETMKRVIRDGNKDFVNAVQKTRVQWILNHKSQAVLTDNQIIWTNETQEAIKEQSYKRQSLSQWFDLLIKQLQQLTELIRTDLKPLYHKIAVALITADVHNRDIVTNLMNMEVESIFDFPWQQQLKYYIQESDLCVVKQVTSSMDYGYQYLGATTRLVITPLTDKCWITITSAVANHLGAAPAGPAGTGKTQSTKDLAKGLARVCIVFNCSDQITAQMMSKLFSGLAQQGAWTCLDQFNRIDIEVLSVIAQQLFSIRVGLKKDKGEVQLEGKILPIKKNFGVFITMNPGYAGRTQLPDNLKSLFRPVAMMIPDYAMIAQIMLFAQGFQNASQLSRKMIQLYKLASQQLSQQKHYDFGLRAVKSLLVMAGELKRSDSKSSEDVVLIKAMKESNIPKFLQNDIYLFEALVSDLFPSVTIQETVNQKLKLKTLDVITQMKLGNPTNVCLKVLQLHQVVNIRFGLMIVGDAGVGKTTCYRILKTAMNKVLDSDPEAGKKYSRVEERVVNPKSVTMGQLYGQIDLLSQQWTDGLLSSIMRECNNDEAKAHFWITLDGPVDAMWIENLNTVLDDNMTLCLANGERIKLRPQLRMLFQVENLEAASPATVSRCGMVYIGPNNNYTAIIEKGVSQLGLEPDLQKHLLGNLLGSLNVLIQLKGGWVQPMPTIKIQVAECLILLIKAMIQKAKHSNSYQQNVKRLNFLSAWALIWAVGSSISNSSYNQFQTAVRAQIQNIFLPKTQTLFDFFVHPQSLLSFVSWQAKLQEFEFPKGCEYHDIMVPTIDTLKYKHIFELMLQIRKPILVTGDSGVGKTSLAAPFLSSKRQNNVITIFLNFSAKTKPKETQLAIESKLNKKGKTLFGARPNQTIAIFIDDINMPELQKQGAQPTIQLLRHFIDYQGFYDRQKLFWKQVVDTTVIGCGATPSGGRNKLNPRYVRHHMVLCLPQPSQSNLKKIFGSILKGFLNACLFSENVKKVADGIVLSTLDFYKTIRKQLLPIPSKFHYMFNLRDISRVFQGILQCSVDNVNNSQKILALWAHQLERVFGDRLNNEEDRAWFYNYCSVVSKRFTEGVEADKIKSKYFTKILSCDTDEPAYEYLDDLKKVVEYLESKIYQYNLQSTGKLQLVFFKETVQHILKIFRVLSQPRGNAMLIGVGGSGKQSLSKLSSFIANCKISQLQFGKNYGIDSFKTDLQKISLAAGADQTPLCFLFVDTQILYEQFLESINNLLNTGQVPNLFKKKEEIDDILNRVRPSALKQKKVDSPESLWSFFIANIRANLHIILCMSPAGDALRVRARKFPSLIDCCTINWFDSWSNEALISVAEKSLAAMPISQDLKKKFTELCKQANIKNFDLARKYYANERRKVQSTPKTYLDQLALFGSILNLKNNQIDVSRKILTQGLEKLYSTNDIVAKLKVQMTKLQPKLEEQCVKTEQFLNRLAKEKEEANVVEQQVLAETLQANEQTIQIKGIKDEAQAELGKALPMLLEAQQALKKINKNDITEIKGYANPHPIVLMVLEAVCILLNEKTDWANIKVVMMDLNFLDKLKNYQKNNISDNILKKLRTYTTKAEFDPQVIGTKNLASKSLSMWCKAIDNYAKVAKEVEPKKKKLAQLEKVFDEKNKVLFMKQKELDKVKEKVAKLQKDCEQTLDFKNKLQSDLDLTGKRLQRAQKLTSLLKDEGLRWSTMIEGFKTLILEIPGQAFLASIYLSYLGPYTGQYRQQIYSSITEVMKQIDIKYPLGFSLTNTLYDQITIRDWILQGLPNDSVSIQNSIIAKKGKRYPLMIDPQIQANRWLKVNQSQNKLSVINFNNPHYLKILQTAVNCGYPVLIEQVEETLESSIDSLLQKKIQIVQGLKMTVLGDKKIAIDQKFYLYMTTRLANPKFLAQIFNKSTVINFSITYNGLKDQFLSDVCKKQKPQIEQQRDQIIVKVAANKKFLKQSQDKILKMLAQSKGMVLDDIELITTLQQSKIKSKEVEKSLQENSIVQEEINLARSLFLPTAIRGTILYFVIAKLCLIEPMYEFSLEYVKKLYQTGLEKAQFNAMIELKIRRLNESITKIMFTSISRSLFQVHKKLYSFLICCAIKKDAKAISAKQWSLFSRGSGIKPKNFKQILPNPQSITPDNWYYLHKLMEIKGLENLFNDFKNVFESYLPYFKKTSIFNQPFPGKQVVITNTFHYLLLSRAFSPENLTFHMSEYVQKELGKFYDQSHVTSIQQVLTGCVYNVPLLFVLSTGVDPTNNILNYCMTKSINLQTISLGQGQGKKAQALIERCQIDGSWVLLNNCHLSKSWLGDLQKIISNFSQQTIQNKNFRLVLSSMPVSYFPSNILQNADKITLEPPRGIKPNISRSFKELNEEVLLSCPNRKKEWLQCLYSLTFFHAILQERRKYGPLGFNVRYQFNDSDLQMSLSTLKNFLNDGRQDINWDAIWYMVGQINYGGRVTDDLDRICLMSTLKKCLNPDLLGISAGEKYYYSESEDYYCLNCHTIEDFQLAIDRVLPNIDTPEVFGLHNNANIAFIIQESNNALSCIQMIEPKEASSNSEDNNLLSIISNLQQLPAPINRDKIPNHLLGQSDKVLPSMTNFLLQEIDKFNNFLYIIDNSLKMLEKAIRGAIPMNTDLDEMTVALENNYLPRIWTKYCYETLKPLASWHNDFKNRVAFLEKCFAQTTNAYWMSCFFFPQGLLTAFLQTHARKHKIPIDTLSFKFKVTQIEKDKLIQPKDGGYIYGLFFEGARYDVGKDTLLDQQTGRLNQPCQTILLLPVENYEIGQNQYNCPCYKTSKRSGVLSTTGQSTNFILGIHLNSKNQKSEYWTLKGTALLCQLNY